MSTDPRVTEAKARAAAVAATRRAEMGEAHYAAFEAHVERVTRLAVHRLTCSPHEDNANGRVHFFFEETPGFGSAACAASCPSRRGLVVSR